MKLRRLHIKYEQQPKCEILSAAFACILMLSKSRTDWIFLTPKSFEYTTKSFIEQAL